MRGYLQATIAAMALMANAASLSELCTVSNVQAALPADGTLLGIEAVSSSVTAVVTTLSSGTMGGPGGPMKRATTNSTSTQYCNVTVTYTHPGKSDSVYVVYAFPSPDTFKNRFYVAGGGGYSLASSATGGITYGAAGGATDAGYAGTSFSEDLMANVLAGNGSINWDNVYMFSYQALGEMTMLGKYLTTGFYGLASDTKIYTYYEGCSDGGREGMSQIQRYGAEYDGAITGAPAFRFAQQQVLHVFPAMVEKTLGYYPPPCALTKIVTATITACDSLDGRTDGVISRTDLCKLNFNLSSLIGQSYSCAASNGSSSNVPGFSSGGSTPAQNGTLTANDIAVASTIYGGLFNSAGQRAYLSWQIGSELSDAATTYDKSTGTWGLDIPSTGGEYVTKFIELLDLSNLSDLDGVTYDTLVNWMNIGMFRYYDSLQTTQPDLSTFMSSGGKLLHYHGESDPSVPSASSVHYWQSVLGAMYANVSHAAGVAAMKDWYQFYLIPGAAHCSTNTLQPGPYPQNNMNIMIDWVENGVQPTRLNATVSSGTYKGETQMLCQWPSRPVWKNNSTFTCVKNSASYNSWTYDFDAFKVAVY